MSWSGDWIPSVEEELTDDATPAPRGSDFMGLDQEMMALDLISAGLPGSALSLMVVKMRDDGRTAIIYANDALLRLTGYPLEEVLGRPHDLLRGPDTPPDIAAMVDAAFRRDDFCDAEMLHYRRDGTPFWNGVTVTPLRDSHGQGGGFLVLMRDVTQRRRADDRLAALADRLHDLAMSDPLTGVANRRNFDAVMEREWRRAKRIGSYTTLAMIDIDHFKSFNDRFGHPAGDSCLRSVAAALNGVVRRPADFVARYGGEEFAILMPDVEPAGAEAMAQRLVDMVRDVVVTTAGGAAGQVTISCGIVSVRPVTFAGGMDEFVAEADRALYFAKAGGRDRMHQVVLDA